MNSPDSAQSSWRRLVDRSPRWRRYLLAALGGSTAIWALVAVVMLFAPRSYSVTSTLILPNADPDARVELKEVGQAYSTSRSTYDSKSLDPRVNYKEIMLSDDVLLAAATAADVPAERFAAPQVKLIDQSSVMQVRSSGRTPHAAVAASRAVLAAFQARLDTLRREELAQREAAVEASIRATRAKLSAAQRELVQFKVQAQLVSERQLEETAQLAHVLERRRLELLQRERQQRATANSLSAQLGLPPRLAGWTVTLQSDAVFLEHFRQFAAAAGQLAEYEHKWDANHPRVREASGLRAGAQMALLQRARTLLGTTPAQADLERLSVVLQDRSRDQLLRDLVAAQAAADAAAAEGAEAARQAVVLTRGLPELASQSAQLDELQRRVKFSEAVYSGAAGKPDVGHSNAFASYPLVQVLVAPSLPQRASFPRLPYLAAGGAAASLFLWIGLVLAWLRNKP